MNYRDINMNHNAISPLVSPPVGLRAEKKQHRLAENVWFRGPQLVVADKNDVCHCLSIKKVMWCLPPACAKHIIGLTPKKGTSSIHFHPVLPPVYRERAWFFGFPQDVNNLYLHKNAKLGKYPNAAMS